MPWLAGQRITAERLPTSVRYGGDGTALNLPLAGSFTHVTGMQLSPSQVEPPHVTISAGGIWTFNIEGYYRMSFYGRAMRSSAANSASGQAVIYKNGAFTGGAIIGEDVFFHPASLGTSAGSIHIICDDYFVPNDNIRVGIDILGLSAGTISLASADVIRTLTITLIQPD